MADRPGVGATVVAEGDDVCGGWMLDVVVLVDGFGAGEAVVVVVVEVAGFSVGGRD